MGNNNSHKLEFKNIPMKQATAMLKENIYDPSNDNDAKDNSWEDLNIDNYNQSVAFDFQKLRHEEGQSATFVRTTV